LTKLLVSLPFHNAFIRTILFCFFSLAYIAAPYWMINQSTQMAILLLVLTALIGLLWSSTASGHTKIKITWNGILSFLLLLLIVGAFNYMPLNSVIPWRGDEDYHIAIVQDFLKQPQSFFPLILSCLLFIYAGWRRSKIVVPAGAAVVMLFALYNYFSPINFYSILRYPYVSRFFQAIVPYFGSFFTSMYHEVFYRVVPFLSTVFIAWKCMESYNILDWRIKLVFGLSVAFMPVLYYYSSILYLEMPAVFLMLIVCLDIEKLLKDDFTTIKTRIGWYALILTGFIKETVIFFLFSFIVSRLVIRIEQIFRKKVDINLSLLWNDLKIIFCVSLPACIYIFYRIHFKVSRTFFPKFVNLMTPEPYLAIIRSWFDQFGFFSILFIAGGAILIYKKKYEFLFFSLFTIATITFSNILDSVDYAGYSRFNLFLVPTILAVTIAGLNFICDKKKISLLLLSMIISINIFLSPVNRDGTKKPFWGNYLCDTSEHYYPYKKTLKWLKKKHPNDKIFFTGMDYPYNIGFNFYFNKIKWFPKAMMGKMKSRKDVTVLGKIFKQAAAQGFNVVVYQARKGEWPEPKYLKNYTMEKVFKNHAHRIIVFRISRLSGSFESGPMQTHN